MWRLKTSKNDLIYDFIFNLLVPLFSFPLLIIVKHPKLNLYPPRTVKHHGNEHHDYKLCLLVLRNALRNLLMKSGSLESNFPNILASVWCSFCLQSETQTLFNSSAGFPCCILWSVSLFRNYLDLIDQLIYLKKTSPLRFASGSFENPVTQALTLICEIPGHGGAADELKHFNVTVSSNIKKTLINQPFLI